MNSIRSLSSSPRGSITLLPGLSEQRRWLVQKCLDIMKRWGYREVVTPIFEFLDVISKGVSSDLIEQGYKLTDRQSGRVMIIRPDVTPQIARIATTSFRDTRPLRLSYALDVFRYEQSHGGRQRELLQIGAELIGVDNTKGDIEVIALLQEILEATGISDYRIILSHSDFLRGIIIQCPEKLRGHIIDIVSKKNLSGLDKLYQSRSISKSMYQTLSRVIFLFGDGSTISEAREIGKNPVSAQALKVLEEFYSQIRGSSLADKILFDLSEAEGLQYHSGIVFHVMDFNRNISLGYGGRYDDMLAMFGRSDSGTGFSLDAQALLRASLFTTVSEGKVLLYAGAERKGLPSRLRDMGFSVVYCYSKGKTLLLREAHNAGADFIIIEVKSSGGLYDIVSLDKGTVKKRASEREILKFFEEVY
jgi:ATP phosphoribosyltransferase regulatory subunit